MMTEPEDMLEYEATMMGRPVKKRSAQQVYVRDARNVEHEVWTLTYDASSPAQSQLRISVWIDGERLWSGIIPGSVRSLASKGWV